jgi:hypothetical protein
MVFVMREVAKCDVCGFERLTRKKNPKQCASQKCRSALWNSGGLDGRTKEARLKLRKNVGKRGIRA